MNQQPPTLESSWTGCAWNVRNVFLIYPTFFVTAVQSDDPLDLVIQGIPHMSYQIHSSAAYLPTCRIILFMEIGKTQFGAELWQAQVNYSKQYCWLCYTKIWFTLFKFMLVIAIIFNYFINWIIMVTWSLNELKQVDPRKSEWVDLVLSIYN